MHDGYWQGGQAFIHKGGLRADMLSNGKLAIGMESIIS